jgi:DNA-binding MarR family transcriptional regulator
MFVAGHEAMSYLMLKTGTASRLVPARVYENPADAQAILQPLRWKILGLLTDRPQCAKDLAKTLKTSEQVVCYHIRELEKTGLIRIERTEKRRGATAKFYRGSLKALAIIPDGQLLAGIGAASLPDLILDSCAKVLDPFVSKGKFDGHIVVGSPDSHGIFRARARDAHLAADIAMFFGSLLPIIRSSIIRLDTEVSQSEMARSLMLIGGPRVNTVTMMVNEWLPVTYELTSNAMMISRITGQTYAGEDEGAVQMIVNPMNQEAKTLVIAGNSSLGTQAAVTAFIKHTEKVAEGNTHNKNIVARVVSGVDQDSDGIIDDVEFLE